MNDMRRAAERYASELAVAMGDRLKSVVLHGSVARGEGVKGVSDINLMVLLDDASPGVLRDLAPLARRWRKESRALPLVLTWAEWAAASDVFAIETADMLDAHAVLHGQDPLAGAEVRDRDLRIQAERELRVKLIHLREAVLATADHADEVGELLVSALPSVVTYLRAALRLGGKTVRGQTSQEVIAHGAALVGADDQPLLDLWALRGRGRAPDMDVADPRTTAIHDVLERTAHYVDTLSGDDT